MGKMKVCHIVNWYPNKWNKQEAIWAKRHVDSLSDYTQNEVFHVQVRHGKFGVHFYETSDYEKSFVITTKLQVWFFKELITTILLAYVLLFKMDRKKYDVFNFHITYPLLTYSKFIQWLIKAPILVTDHWSAYHFNFGVKKRLKRIERIFSNKKLSFICVSKSLHQDIESFARTEISASIIPNVVNTDVFNCTGEVRENNQMFILSYWKSPKDPFIVLEAVKRYNEENEKNVCLKIGGFGPLLDEMKQFMMEHNLENDVEFLGKMEAAEIADELNKSSVFLHSSDYEVASVVCMESISCGCPVIASNVGGITEYIDETNGLLVDGNNPDSWMKAIQQVLTTTYEHEKMAVSAKERFDAVNVGKRYYEALKGVIERSESK